MWAIIAELAIAIISVVASAAVSDSQMKQSETRNAKETFVHKIYSAVKDKFGITKDQLDQAMSELDLNLTNLAEATKGSARLSKATRIYQRFLSEYPDKVKTINRLKNDITQAINNVSSKESGRASELQSRKYVSTLDIQKDLDPEIDAVQLAIKDVNSLGGKQVQGSNDLTAMKTGKDESGKTIEEQKGSAASIDWNDVNVPINPVTVA